MTRTEGAADAAIAEYVEDLELTLRDLPRGRRRELVADLRAHIAEARAQLPDPSDEVAVLLILARLGQPTDIAAEERQDFAPAAGADGGPGWREPAALVLLLFGGFVAGFGWLAGVVLLWWSPRWTVGEKVLGTLVIPGGLATSATLILSGLVGGYACDGTGCDGPHIGSIIEVAVLALAPIVVSAILASRGLDRRRRG
ncbi:HAAS signaling domain-containing protein [Conexibacter woesei]|uniref:HAAS signaling domain-containing protein n=1 Tax=Conexibacter woesei TaxID=191495 RepID=UPI0012DF3CEC|nr:hypothetical protein [Conexibacter woesei]